MLTPTNEVLIKIEHEGQVPHEDLRGYYKNSLKGIIGKLEAQSLIERVKSKTGGVMYQLTPNGRSYIDLTLDCLHKKEISWDDRWTTVFFSVPENNRPNRDRLRRYLQKLGFGNLYGSVWISPHNHISAIRNFARKLAIAKNVTILTSRAQDKSTIVNSAWDLSSIKKRYNKFLIDSQSSIRNLKPNSPNYGLKIKKIIFDLALIISTEPDLPKELLPGDWPKPKAMALYREVRKKL